LGGGALLELSHEIDYLRWLFGDVDWVRATLSRQSDLELDVEDTAHLILGFLSLDENYSLIGTVTLDFIRHDTTRLCTAIGSNGSLRWNGVTGQVSVYPNDGNGWREVFHNQHNRDDSYLAEWKNFIACISGQSTPMITGEDGLKVLQIIEAARNSAASGCQVSVAETSKTSKAVP
jgi:predicted dehydrogenase